MPCLPCYCQENWVFLPMKGTAFLPWTATEGQLWPSPIWLLTTVNLRGLWESEAALNQAKAQLAASSWREGPPGRAKGGFACLRLWALRTWVSVPYWGNNSIKRYRGNRLNGLEYANHLTSCPETAPQLNILFSYKMQNWLYMFVSRCPHWPVLKSDHHCGRENKARKRKIAIPPID